MANDFRCGYITIIGRPNVGKSTLLNSLLDQKLSITSRKPQTTRWHILGIKSEKNYQAIYVDTPGLLDKKPNALTRHMRKEVLNSLYRVDIVVFVIESLIWTKADEFVLELLGQQQTPVILAINKIDKVRDKAKLLPFIGELSKTGKFAELIPISAAKNINIGDIEQRVLSLLPRAQAEFPVDQVTDRNERFYAGEFIREQLMCQIGDEIPYRMAVTIEGFRLLDDLLHIDAVIWVEKEGQKRIIIGKHGMVLKKAGTLARKDMEAMFGHRVYLQTRVKIKKKWTDDLKAVHQFGYNS
jgi:GTP-binding protein Era